MCFAFLLAAVFCLATAARCGEERIFFSGLEYAGYDLYSVLPDGTGKQRITTLAGDEKWPALSPDGSRLAYIHVTEDETSLEICDLDGGNRETASRGMVDAGCAWSGTGRSLYAVDSEGLIVVSIYDGSKELVYTSELAIRHPDYNNKAEKILFQLGAPTGTVSMIEPDGTGFARLLNSSLDVGPCWSPDGSRVVFGRSAPSRGWDVAMITADGTGAIERLHHDFRGGYAGVSPDGESIVLSRGDEESPDWAPASRSLYITPAEKPDDLSRPALSLLLQARTGVFYDFPRWGQANFTTFALTPPAAFAMVEDEKKNIEASATPEGGRYLWSVSDGKVIQVFGNGSHAQVHGMGPGTASVEIQYLIEDRILRAATTVTVREAGTGDDGGDAPAASALALTVENRTRPGEAFREGDRLRVSVAVGASHAGTACDLVVGVVFPDGHYRTLRDRNQAGPPDVLSILLPSWTAQAVPTTPVLEAEISDLEAGTYTWWFILAAPGAFLERKSWIDSASVPMRVVK
jgi:hypothetical protein